MAHEAMRTMVAAFAEAGRLREAADMVLEMQSRGLPLRVGLQQSACYPHAREVFDGMTRMTDYRSSAICSVYLPSLKCTFHDYMGPYIALKSVECTCLSCTPTRFEIDKNTQIIRIGK
jgi:pentatricopeptide repeat protein